ncbi:MAG: zinc ribbon domain-containing protein [Bacillota bacterium]
MFLWKLIRIVKAAVCHYPEMNMEAVQANGTKSNKYCSHCYQNGAFTMPEITSDEMKEKVKGKIREFGFPGFLAGLFTHNNHKLERWK